MLSEQGTTRWRADLTGPALTTTGVTSARTKMTTATRTLLTNSFYTTARPFVPSRSTTSRGRCYRRVYVIKSDWVSRDATAPQSPHLTYRHRARHLENAAVSGFPHSLSPPSPIPG